MLTEESSVRFGQFLCQVKAMAAKCLLQALDPFVFLLGPDSTTLHTPVLPTCTFPSFRPMLAFTLFPLYKTISFFYPSVSTTPSMHLVIEVFQRSQKARMENRPTCTYGTRGRSIWAVNTILQD